MEEGWREEGSDGGRGGGREGERQKRREEIAPRRFNLWSLVNVGVYFFIPMFVTRF